MVHLCMFLGKLGFLQVLEVGFFKASPSEPTVRGTGFYDFVFFFGLNLMLTL
jgi:hypothetical protein